MGKTTTTTKRLLLLDEYRGLLLLQMILYHALWDLVYIFGNQNFPWFGSAFAHIWQQSICWGFIFLSGFCWQLSRHPFQRGLTVFGGGLLVTAATLLALPSSRVLFGVLTLIGSSMLLMCLLHPFLQKIPALAGSIGSFLFFLILYPVNRGYLGFAPLFSLEIPSACYANLLTAFLGFPNTGFFSTDYFSLLPWFFLFTAGYFASRFVLPKKQILILLRCSICPPLRFLGQHSLIIYMLHQPVLYALFFCFSVF